MDDMYTFNPVTCEGKLRSVTLLPRTKSNGRKELNKQRPSFMFICCASRQWFSLSRKMHADRFLGEFIYGIKTDSRLVYFVSFA
jgi:hypothetical protein